MITIYIKSQIYDKLVTMLLSYDFSVTKGLFQLLLMQAFQYNQNTCSLEISNPFQKISEKN